MNLFNVLYYLSDFVMPFHNRCGNIPMDLVFQRFIRKHVFTKFYTENFHKKIDLIEYTRNDYFRSSIEDYDYWLLRKKWIVLPTIQIIKNKVPVVLTCRYHHNGNNKMMVHTPRLPKHILPSKYSDQLAHCVIHCRTVKPMKSTKYSTQFQLFKQKGTFNGIDTFGITDFQNMEIFSELLAHYESLAIVHRRDTNALLTKMSDDGKIGKCVANSRREEANHRVTSLGLNLENLLSGATYVPLEATMKFIKNQSTYTPLRNVRVINVNEGNRERIQKFRPIWPICLFPCHKLDEYGARFPSIPTFQPQTFLDSDQINIPTTILLWAISALMTRIENLWHRITIVEF